MLGLNFNFIVFLVDVPIIHYRFMITTEKESGVISGLQHSENGPIEWNRDLPRHCKLSL